MSHSLSGVMLNKEREVAETKKDGRLFDLPMNLAIKKIHVGPISHKGKQLYGFDTNYNDNTPVKSSLC